MKKTSLKLCSIILISLFIASAFSPISVAFDESVWITWPMPLNRTTVYVGGSGPGNFSKIQDAVDNASEGDIVFVYSGFYQENILIHTSIHLIGMQNSTTIIDGGASGTVVSISADNTSIQGFTIQNAKDDVNFAGVEISHSDDVLVLANIIQDNGGLGISLQGSDTVGTKIAFNTVRNNSYGIYLFDSPHTLIEKNNISSNWEGVYVVGSYESTIRNNTVTNRGLGIHVESAYSLIISGNNIVSNSQGIYMFNSSKVTFDANTIGWNRWYGMWLKACSDNTIIWNSISSNIDVGLFLESSFDTSVRNNTFWDNDNGVYLKDSAGNIIQ
jgi:nitrous oxidase accessory protein